ncbi:hypothetical protein SDC9_182130 [bioreactor metagenome]|uniref:Uncharacterized protein n=1 Tax=bioreactor metagenome TaxID=1076179 RepID=A0A645H803_9ZZZZ
MKKNEYKNVMDTVIIPYILENPNKIPELISKRLSIFFTVCSTAILSKKLINERK